MCKGAVGSFGMPLLCKLREAGVLVSIGAAGGGLVDDFKEGLPAGSNDTPPVFTVVASARAAPTQRADP